MTHATVEPDDVHVVLAPPGFADWPGLLELLHTSYAYMESRIDPPSSLFRMDVHAFEEKSRHEVLILALRARVLVGCAFADIREDCVYVGKVAVHGSVRGRGIARRIMQEVEALAREAGKPSLELETRIELVENQRIFAALGFAKVAETAHPGYDHPTSVTMRRAVGLLTRDAS